MSSFTPSAALLRTRIVGRSDQADDGFYGSGAGTKPASKSYEKQSLAGAAQKVARRIRRPLPAPEREKEIKRRREWSGGGNMPPELRSHYSESERAVMCVIAQRCKEKGFCDLCIDEIARIAGVGRTSAQNAIRKARSNERRDISVRERPQRAGKNLTNIIRIVSETWRSWIKRAIGFKNLSTSVTQVYKTSVEKAERVLSAFERECKADRRAPSEAQGSSAGDSKGKEKGYGKGTGKATEPRWWQKAKAKSHEPGLGGEGAP
ncbi:hypothetical protein [Rhizobium halophytocola]|uniref:Helix-turn-helix domain-containing protein n=1 Tax=Rhizobium halophytocola TaxID=735519 RepID=A0ABS4E587_9HYPH|nr:hypothetical protein [Rhizobium halophytocola]MBP1853071.1 hypothetical protein [Rhizobium halophytocola]